MFMFCVPLCICCIQTEPLSFQESGFLFAKKIKGAQEYEANGCNK